MADKLTILYDPQMFDLQKYGGITRYFANLITAINQKEASTAILPIVCSYNYYVRNFPQLVSSQMGKLLLRKPSKKYHWNLKYCIKKMKETNFDIFHATYFDPYFLPYLNKPLVITVHDMIHENHPELFNDSDKVIANKKICMEAATLIIAISNYTRDGILRYYPHLKNKIRVIYHGLPDRQIEPAQEDLPESYMLYVGDRNTPYKNFLPTIHAIASLINKQGSPYLICAGGGKFTQKEIEVFSTLGITDKMIQVNPPDAIMKQLYQQALLFIYPSLEEGFGLPMLEAFKNGCPVASSNTSCLPEVGGDAVSYFDPNEGQTITQTISELIENPELRNKRRADGYEQLKEFTFESCLNKTLACYNDLIS